MSTYGHGDKKYGRSGRLLSSVGRGWSGIAAELRAHPVREVAPFNPVYTEVTIAIRGCSGLVRRTGGGERQETRSEVGKIWLSPAGVGMDDICITAPHEEVLHLYLPAQPFSSLANDDMLRIGAHSLRYLADIKDEMIRQIGLVILSEMTSETAAGRMLVETSALALAARLAHSYAEPVSVRPQRFRSHRLDETRLRRVLDYIAQHLDEDITVAQLAGVACLSPFHFARMFGATLGVAPHRYVSQQRLESAMALLAAGKRPLSDIALSCQFSSQASFNRAFRRATGMTPGEYRRLGGSREKLPPQLAQTRSKLQQALERRARPA
jgi:AraC family transcriptional regulator